MWMRCLLGVTLLAASCCAVAQDVEFCVDTVSELDDAVAVAGLPSPLISRVLVRVEQGTYDLSTSDLMRAAGQSSLVLHESLSILGGYTNNCAGRAINANNTVLTNFGSEVLRLTPSRDFTLQGFHFSGFNNAISFTQFTTNDTQQRIELSNNRFTLGNGELRIQAEAGNDTSLILFKNNQFFARSTDGDCLVRFQGDNGPDTAVRLIVANNTLAGNIGGGDAMCLSQIEQPEFYNNVLFLNPGDDLRGLGNTGSAVARNNVRQSTSGLTFSIDQNNSSTDPLFVDYPAGDLRLQAASTAINSGFASVPFGTGSVDLAGVNRVQGLTIDRGANESSNTGLFVLTVTSTADSGAGTLREAITQANATPGLNGILFNIPGAGCPKVITLSSALPAITESLVINGASQSGTLGNTLDLGYNGQRCILLKGNSALFGLQVPSSAPASTALTVDSVVFGNFAYGIFLQGGSDHRIVGSHFGVTLGATSNAGGGGIYVSGADDVQIGGSDPNERNVFALQNQGGAFISAGVLISQGSLRTEVINNFFGTQPNGVLAGDNDYGIVTDGNDGTFSDNLIANSSETAIWLRSNATNNLVNLSRVGLPVFCIGTCPTTSANGRAMQIDGQFNRTLRNEFAYNTAGIRVTGNDNSVSSTLVYGGPFGAPPIDIGDVGFSSNDNDGAANPPAGNRGINYPLLLSARPSTMPGMVTVDGAFQSVNGNYRVHIYASERRVSAGLVPRCEGSAELAMLNVLIDNAPAGNVGSGSFSVDISTAEIAGRLLTAQAVRRSMFNGTVVLADSSEYGACREAPLFASGFEGNQ
jgi:hypothetical protein